jgi:phage tail-like protein
MNGRRGDPVLAFRFFVLLGDTPAALKNGLSMLKPGSGEVLLDAGFSECSGLGMEQQLYDYQEGGLLDSLHKLPGQVNFGLITLRWGMGFNNTLWDWHIGNARALAYGEQFKRKDGTLICLPYADVDDPLATSAGTQVWYFRRAIPVRWTGPQFDANRSEVAIESIELAHEGLERWFPANLDAVAASAAGAGRAHR